MLPFYSPCCPKIRQFVAFLRQSPRRERGQEGARQIAQQNLDEPDLEKERVFHQPRARLLFSLS